MNYYSARIAVVCIVPGPMPQEGYTVDVQVHVFKAKDFDDAATRAKSIGASEEHSYENQFGDRVDWRFLRIENITHLGADLTRTEVSSRMEAWLPEDVKELEVNDESILKDVEYFDESPA